MIKLFQSIENKTKTGEIMLSPKKSPDSKSKFKPFDYAVAFFNPVSRESLKDSFNKSDEMSKDIKELLAKSRALHQEIDKCLQSQSPSVKTV